MEDQGSIYKKGKTLCYHRLMKETRTSRNVCSVLLRLSFTFYWFNLVTDIAMAAQRKCYLHILQVKSSGVKTRGAQARACAPARLRACAPAGSTPSFEFREKCAGRIIDVILGSCQGCCMII